ncbi:MAG TPA: PTS mannose transporter subunit IIC [Erysipelotrichaceae bacterium]|nr:PTS mannose transporter subunit IIC [Erysipelotrichaceae bacterium]
MKNERKIVIASHGLMAKGMEDTCRMIIGDLPYEIESYSLVPGRHPDEFRSRVEDEIRSNPEKEYVILTDLYGASVCTSMYQLLVYENVVLFSGMNLNLLLILMLEYPERLKKEDIEAIVRGSADGLKQVRLSAEEEEDF